MRTLARQRRVKEAVRRQYKVVARFTEATYMCIDWKDAMNRFKQDFPLEKDFDVYVHVNSGAYGHYRYLRSNNA